MISNISPTPQKVQMIDREHLLRLLKNGLEAKSFRFTRQAALVWLSAFPGDLEVNLYYVIAQLNEGRAQQAAQVLERILKNDPLYVEALKIGVELFSIENPIQAKKCNGVLQALGEQPSQLVELPDWGAKLIQVKQMLANRRYDEAQGLLMPVMGDSTHPEMADLLHLEITSETADATSVLNLARLYQKRWPECLQINLILAKAWMETGNDDEAVKMMHLCAANDASAQVPTRMWGSNFVYRPLYPSKMEVVSSFSVPAEVAGKLGMNILNAGPGTPSVTTFASYPKSSGQAIYDDSAIEEAEAVEPEMEQPIRTEVSSFDGYKVLPTEDGSFQEHPRFQENKQKPAGKSSTVKEVEEELKKVAESINQPVISNSDNRFPAYVILSMKKGLETQYGAQSTQVIQDELKKLMKSIQEKNAWSSIMFMPDDLEICGRYGITPIDAIDPWKIKLALADLDKALQKKGERIGCVLIVGGESIVPFHKLPNPTEDSDAEVKSDNPYGSLDTNYFVSDWPVGRLPGEAGSEVGLLLTQIRNTVQYHQEEAQMQTWVNRIMNMVRAWNMPWIKNNGNIGYTASIWKRSSLAAFRPIGEGKSLFLSPNGKTPAFAGSKLTTAPIGFFNLHGVEDGSDWYGQKDPADKLGGPDYPTALKPSELIKNSNSPRIVYSEACYGGHIFGKKEEESIALTMTGIGVLAMIGSSTIAYGSISTPLIGADLVGYLIMKNLSEGLAIGNAFIKAKVDFVREMNRRQGYLDGEDQKTLISFILYGDPLVAYDPYQGAAKNLGREAAAPVVKTICDRTTYDEKSATVTPKMVLTAKELVKDYLPGIEYAEVRIQNQQARMVAGGGKSVSQPKRVVVSFSKQVNQAEKIHKHFAKVTLDQQGQVLKVAVSR